MIKSKTGKVVQIGLLMGSMTFLHAALPLCKDIWPSGINSTLAVAFDTGAGEEPTAVNFPDLDPTDGVLNFVAPSPSTGLLECTDSVSGFCDENGSARPLIPDLGVAWPANYFTGVHGEYIVTTDAQAVMYLPHYDVAKVDVGAGVHVTLDQPGRVHVVTTSTQFTLGEGATWNCGADGNTPGDPNDLFVFVASGEEIQFVGDNCFYGYIYSVDHQQVLGSSAPTRHEIHGAISADNFTTIKNTDFNYTTPTASVPEICNGTEHNWTLVGVPAEMNATTGSGSQFTVGDIFGYSLGIANYNTTHGAAGWTLFRRTYNGGDNNSQYDMLDIGEYMNTGEGYYLLSNPHNPWDVDYNATATPPLVAAISDLAVDEKNCTAVSGCVEYALELPHGSCTGEAAGQNFRNIMIGTTGRGGAVWDDYRFYDHNTSTAYSPLDITGTGYATNQIWKWNNVLEIYDVCSDDGLSTCLTPSHTGFWIQLRCPANSLIGLDLIMPNVP